MEVLRPLGSLVLLGVGANHAYPQERPTLERPPIIDMHIHAFSWDHQGKPPPPSPVTGRVPPARTDKEAMEASLAELKRYNVVFYNNAVRFLRLDEEHRPSGSGHAAPRTQSGENRWQPR